MIVSGKTKVWCSPEDLGQEQIDLFRRADTWPVGTHPFMTAHSIPNQDPINAIYHKAMILSIHSEMNKIEKFICVPYAVFLTDDSGCILDLVCSSPEVQAEMSISGIIVGASLSRQNSGLNAVSLSMEMQCIGVVKGEEHSDPTFTAWNCVCAPLYLDGQVLGYVDISFPRGQQIEFAVPFVQQMVSNVAGRWVDRNSDLQQYKREIIFREYKLTAREKEVAHLWSLEKSALYISNELGISEGTVRNMVKSVYSKLNVNDRWQFSKKLAE